MENASSGNESFKDQLLILSKSAGAILAGLNIFFSITASLGNVLMLIALHKVTIIHPPTKLLLRCLTVTDLCVGLVSQPSFAITLVPDMENTNKNLYYYSNSINNSSGFILCTVSLMTAAAVSVDRLLALMLGLKYRQAVTLKRVRAFITFFWILPSGSNALSVTIPNGFSYSRITVLVFLLMSLLLAGFSYIKIYIRLRHHQLRVVGHAQQTQPPNGGAIPLNIARYKKTVSSMALVQLALLVCYTPLFVVLPLFAVKNGPNKYTPVRVVKTLVFLNSSLNPILYCWKIREVKAAVRDTITNLECCLKHN